MVTVDKVLYENLEIYLVFEWVGEDAKILGGFDNEDDALTCAALHKEVKERN